MQATFHQNKLGQSKSKLVTNLVDSCGLQVPGSRNPPPAGVCGARETCCCIFSLLNIFCDSNIFLSLARQLCLARLEGEAAVTRPASAGLVTRPVIGWRGCKEASDWGRDHYFSESEATSSLQIYTYNTNNTTRPS